MSTSSLTFYATERDRGVSAFFASRTRVAVEELSVEQRGETGLRLGDQLLPLLNLVPPVALRESLATVGIATPEYRVVHSADEIQGLYPAAQPLTIRVGQGTQFAQYAADAGLPYVRLVNTQGETDAVLEVPPAGSAHWVFGLVEQGALRVSGIVDIEWRNDVRRFPFCLSAPTRLTESYVARLQEIAGNAVNALTVRDGPVRVECIVDGDSIQVTEVDTGWLASAMPIDLLHIAGIADYWGEQCALLGIEVEAQYSEPKPVALQWLRCRSGIVVAIEGVESVRDNPDVVRVEIIVQPQEKLGHVVDLRSRDRIGYVVATGVDPEAAITNARLAAESIVIHRQTVIGERS